MKTVFLCLSGVALFLAMGFSCGFAGCRSKSSLPIVPTPSLSTPALPGMARGFAKASPWASCYGPASGLGGLTRAGRKFRILNIEADPGVGGYTPAQIARLKVRGARVISYLNLGACESFRTYWTQVPAGFVSGKANTAAHLGPYAGYPDEIWMNLGNVDYQNLIVNYVAPRLVAQGVDGFFFDNLELVEHGSNDANGRCDAACRQGGLDLVRRLREKYPSLLFVMQNATSNITRLGQTGGAAFPSLLDGISHEEVYAPQHDSIAESELQSWRDMRLKPGGHPFWIGTEDYVGSSSNIDGARAAYAASRAQCFSPYATDASEGQQTVYYWSF